MLAFSAAAQDVKTLLNVASGLEKSFNDAGALEKYEQVLDLDPKNSYALGHASRMLSNIAGRMEHDAQQHQMLERSRSYAMHAIKINNNDKEAHLNYVIALGLLTDIVKNSAEKIEYAKIIHSEAELLLKLDSLYAPAFYILGKWNLSLATLSWLEKMACSVLYSAIPKASLHTAIRYLDKAIALQPDYILFHYNRALAYYYSDNIKEASHALQTAFTLPMTEPDDKIRIAQCVALQKKIQNNL